MYEAKYSVYFLSVIAYLLQCYYYHLAAETLLNDVFALFQYFADCIFYQGKSECFGGANLGKLIQRVPICFYSSYTKVRRMRPFFGWIILNFTSSKLLEIVGEVSYVNVVHKQIANFYIRVGFTELNLFVGAN